MPALNAQQVIWQTVAAIPFGKVATYGQVARVAGLPNYARYVGTVLKNLPEDTALPWHRVVNAQGRLSFPTGSDAYQRQFALLISEGVVILEGKISIADYAWQP